MSDSMQCKISVLGPSEWRGKQLKEMLMLQGGNRGLGLGGGNPRAIWGGGIEEWGWVGDLCC